MGKSRAHATPVLRFFKSLTAQPKSSWEGNLHPPIVSSLGWVDRVSLWVSGDIVTCLIPYSAKQCCRICSVFSHCSSDVPTGTQTWRDARITLTGNKLAWKPEGQNTTYCGAYDCERCHTWISWTERTPGICRNFKLARGEESMGRKWGLQLWDPLSLSPNRDAMVLPLEEFGLT